MSAADLESIRADVAELREMAAAARSERVRGFLESKISSLQNDIRVKEAQAERDARIAASAAAEAAAAASRVQSGFYEPVPAFGWDQGDGTVSVYIIDNMEGLVEGNVQASFTSTSFSVRITTGSGRRYSLARNTSAEIVSEKCRVKVKPDRVTLVLKKKTARRWAELEPKKAEAGAKAAGAAAKEDPGDSIMQMMKKLYDEGDTNMKQMINKAWSEAQSKKTGAGGSGGLGDMDFE
jgi:calcyclin binding protein